MNLEPFFTMHALVEELRRQCVIDYWEQRQSDDPLGQFGPRQLNQLIVIMNHQPCALQDVMHHTGLSAPAASAAVDKLVRAGIVHRELNPENRRSIRLTVDPEIRKSLDEIDRNFRAGRAAVSSGNSGRTRRNRNGRHLSLHTPQAERA